MIGTDSAIFEKLEFVKLHFVNVYYSDHLNGLTNILNALWVCLIVNDEPNFDHTRPSNNVANGHRRILGQVCKVASLENTYAYVWTYGIPVRGTITMSYLNKVESIQ